MHILLTGANGTVGRFITKRLTDEGHMVTALGRGPVSGLSMNFERYDLEDEVPGLPEADVLVHCALAHVPGKFRNGEGDDPDGFWRKNVHGSETLFGAAKDAGCRQVVFLSSRAVYGDHRTGETLYERDPATPDTLYGEVKLAGEAALAKLCAMNFQGTALRATGVYGQAPGAESHKWAQLFDDFRDGKAIDRRCASEVHGEDLAQAVALILEKRDLLEKFELFNVSDVLIDRREILAGLPVQSNVDRSLPEPSSARPGQMDTGRLRAFGWRPGGKAKLMEFVASC